MKTRSDEHDDIAKLLRDAFVRICQLAIADCGVSVAELTLHLSVQVNTGVPQVLSTTLVETVESPPKESDCTEPVHSFCDHSAASGSKTLNKSQHVIDSSSDSHRDGKELFSIDHPFGSSVQTDGAGSQFFNGSVAEGSLPPSGTSECTFTAATDPQLISSPVDLHSVNSLILSEDSPGEVPLDEFLADVEKSSNSDEYVVSESPSALLNVRQNKQVLHGSNCTSVSTVSFPKDSLVAANGACVLTTLQSCDSDGLTQCTHCIDSVLFSSDRQCPASNLSFLHQCRLDEQDAVHSASAFRDITEISRSSPSVDELSGSNGTEPEVDSLSTSQHMSLYGNAADGADRNDISYEEELVVDESDTHTSHNAVTESSSLSVNGHPGGNEAVAVIKDVSLLKPCTATHLLSTVGTAQQPSVLSIGPNSYRLIKMNADNVPCDTQETEFQKLFSSVSTNVSAAIQETDQGKCCVVLSCDLLINVRNFT